ncbi:hypothetical protein GCM10010156_38910 [Planobispora rosea]|uniref:Uncharacterized protein n=1 Tax=Planobispora rosea TaxID=35762 RepID=A0A8J3S224_PLARO|nr:hypothetical protein [Planobispora rosea]GGS76360.1 hypothetical protein GCM10010156_38910 [Planobispora rosea]GIH86227.1 hypothetical protein Pro02_46350 [Planobispora rosea]
MPYGNESNETRAHDWRPYLTAGAALAATAVVIAAFAVDSGRYGSAGSAMAPPAAAGLLERPAPRATGLPALPLLPQLASAVPAAVAAEPPPGPEPRKPSGRSGLPVLPSGHGTDVRAPAVQNGGRQGVDRRPGQAAGRDDDRPATRAGRAGHSERPGRNRAAARSGHRSQTARPAKDTARPAETGRRPSGGTHETTGRPARPSRPDRSTSCARIPLTDVRYPYCGTSWSTSEGRGLVETILRFVAPRRGQR